MDSTKPDTFAYAYILYYFTTYSYLSLHNLIFVYSLHVFIFQQISQSMIRLFHFVANCRLEINQNTNS